MKRELVIVVVAVALLAGCSGDSKPNPGTRSPAASASAVTPGATATLEAPSPTAGATATLDVNGRPVPLYQATIAQPQTAPRSLSLLVTHGCYGCDVPDMAIERVTWDARGTKRSETLFSAKESGGSYITGIGATADGSVLVAGVCVRSYCGPMGTDFYPDSRVTLLRSLDRGVSWAELATVDGYAFPRGVAPDGQAIVQRLESFAISYVAKLPSGDRFTTPQGVSPGYWPLIFGGEPFWNTGQDRTLEFPSNSWTLDIPVDSVATNVVPWGRGGLLYQWLDRKGSGAKAYVGDPYEDGFLDKAWESPPIDLEMRSWPGGTTLVGNASLDNSRRLPALVLQGPDPGQLTIQLVDAPDFPPADRNRVVSGMVGPFARVVGTGDCLHVRAEPSTAAASLGCFKDGVLLHDLGNDTEVDGRRWAKVLTPTPPDDWTGKQGWASTEFLER